MELKFSREPLQWMKRAVHQVQTREQTQELKLTDGMPDIGRVLGAWGQPVIRSKEWRSDCICVSGGMMVWVLYAPEDGTQPRCVNGWIPWQMEWDLPEDVPDGQIRVLAKTRFVDARSVSPRKIMVRAGVSALGEGLVESQIFSWKPEEMPEDVQLLETTYPVRMSVEAGEKTFSLDEELILPQSCPAAAKLMACRLSPEITESRILGSRLLFRGNASLHVVYVNESGQLFGWDFPVSISQYTDLAGTYGPDAQADLWVMVTELELDLDEEGHFRLKCGLVAQYEVDDVKMLGMVEDAYSLSRQLQLEREEQMLQPVLEKQSRNLPVDLIIPQDADVIADVSFFPDFPRQREQNGVMEVEQPGMVQVLYYNPEGSLQSSLVRWEGKLDIPAHPDSILNVVPAPCNDPDAQITGEGIRLRGQLPLSVQTSGNQAFSPVTLMQLGEAKEANPDRPSLILCRAGEKSLWQLARENGSTVHAIRNASGLDGDPEPNRMLLIPVL